MTDLSKKSLFIIFVKENCISTLGQKSINHPKKCSSEMSIFTEFTLWKYHFFLKQNSHFSKSHDWQNSQIQNLFFTNFTLQKKFDSGHFFSFEIFPERIFYHQIFRILIWALKKSFGVLPESEKEKQCTHQLGLLILPGNDVMWAAAAFSLYVL